MKTLFINIKKLVQTEEGTSDVWRAGKEMSHLGCIDNAYLLIDGDKIDGFGTMDSLVGVLADVVDVEGKMILPAFCDSHTHLVYAGSREMEYTDKIKGLSYQEIAKRGGGILNSAKLLHSTGEEELYKQTLVRAKEIIAFGTGAVEIKSGYGLT